MRLYDLLEKIIRNSGARWGETIEIKFKPEKPGSDAVWTAPSDGVLTCADSYSGDYVLKEQYSRGIIAAGGSVGSYDHIVLASTIPVHGGRVYVNKLIYKDKYTYYFTPFA